MDINNYKVSDNSKFHLSDIETIPVDASLRRKEGKKKLKENIEKMILLQDKLYAHDKYSILVVFQAMDTAGKDGAIKHVMSGLNPQGTQVHSFKVPSVEELNHDYLWRASKRLPERGQIGIFNRSYYEEVLVVKVHDLIKNQSIPSKLVNNDIWNSRYRQIRDYERFLFENGYVFLKFFLHISKEVQKERLLARIDNPAKNWKFSEGDIKERGYWEAYQKCYQEAISATGVENAPWFVIPSDKKWYARMVISEVIIQTLDQLELSYPKLDNEQLDDLKSCRESLLEEK